MFPYQLPQKNDDGTINCQKCGKPEDTLHMDEKGKRFICKKCLNEQEKEN